MTNPRNYIAAENLRDGTPVSVRAIRCDDNDGVLKAYNKLSRDAIYTRFFHHKKELTTAELSQFTNIDFDRVVALIVTTKNGNEDVVIGGGRYIVSNARCPRRSAEVAFTTAEDYQGRGLAQILLRHLVRIAGDNGVSLLNADVLAENHPMLRVFRRSGLPMRQDSDGGVMHVTLWLTAQDPANPRGWT